MNIKSSSAKWGFKENKIREWCGNNLIPGVEKKTDQWVIPDVSVAPKVMTFFKYYRYNKKYFNDFLSFGIYASSLNDLNDAYEKYNINERAINQFRVVCLTKSLNKKTLWTYYSGSTGIMIAFQINTSVVPLERIEYVPVKKFLEQREGDNIIPKAFFCKDRKFAEENEFRAVLDTYNLPEGFTEFNGNIIFQ